MHRALTVLLGLPADRVRVVQTETGGGFGGKEEYPSHIACHAALLARKARPAGEDDLRPRRGHARDDQAASRRSSAIAPGVTRDGRLVAMDIDVVLDAGAYCTLSPVVLSRGVHSRVGPVRVPERAHPRTRDAHQHAAERRVPRLRRAADAVCASKCTWIASPRRSASIP